MKSKLVLCVLSLPLAVFGQTSVNPQDVQTLRGFVPTSSYSVSDLETINKTNGNVLFHLPIVSLPPGRAGHSSGVSLMYNSTIYDESLTGYNFQDYASGQCQDRVDLTPSETGGWQLGMGYRVRMMTRPFGCGAPVCPVPKYNWRCEMIFPDGSAHTLVPVNVAVDSYLDPILDGYSPVDTYGTIYTCQPANPPNGFPTDRAVPIQNVIHSLDFYTIDGTFARVKLTRGDPTNWIMRFADGRMVTNIPSNRGGAPSATTFSLPAATANSPYSQALGATGAAGYTWSVESGSSLPPGLVLSAGGPDGGLIIGTPTGPPYQTYYFTLRVTDANGLSADTPQLALTVQQPGSLYITSSFRDDQGVGVFYSYPLGATSTAGPPYTWSVMPGYSLPPGLSLSGGVLSGTLTTAGNYRFGLQVTDVNNSTAPAVFSLSVSVPSSYLQSLYDKNQNYDYMSLNWDPSIGLATATLGEPVTGRLITVANDTTNNNWTINATGGNGTALTWTVSRGTLQSTQTYDHFDCGCQSDPSYITPPLLPAIPVVTQVQLPALLGGGSYMFDYNGTPQNSFTGSTSFSGELRTVTLPTGATVAYQYYWNLLSNPRRPLLDGPNVVRHKTVSIGGQTQEDWGYLIGPPAPGGTIGISQVTAPDGGLTSETYWSGLAVSTTLPDMSKIERRWEQNPPILPQSNVTGGGVPPSNALYNPFVAIEYKSLSDGTNPITTAITEFQQDKNGNATDVKEHDFVDYSIINASRGTGVDNLPNGTPGTVLRETTSTYYVPTASQAQNYICPAGYYCDPNSPRTGKSIHTHEVLTSSSLPKAYSEYSYDDPYGTANPTQEARWDDTKTTNGAFPPSCPASTPTSSCLVPGTNAVATHSTYTSSGNRQTSTDENGNATRYDYGSVCNSSDLFPTTVTRANGTSVALATLLQTYDCNTGLVTSSQDPNGINTVTTYDAAGRMTQVQVAGFVLFDRTFQDPTPNDNKVYTISRTHLDSTNKHVIVQRFDPLFRPSLTQELEATEPSGIGSDLTSGIKTQRSYSFTTAGNFELVSNPYRGTTDDTMGWTRTLRDKMGRVLEVGSYLGASLPAPWGTNGTTSGKVQTSYSANASGSTGGSGSVTTVTDQNSNSRQNITDRLGRLKQVTEGGSYITQYNYDLLDNLTTVTQGAVARNFTYSSLGRLLTADNPETRFAGRTMNYTYDDAGNLKTRTDTRLTVATLGYDALNRITSKTYSGGTAQPTPNVVYCYDGNVSANGGACAPSSPAISNPKGRLTSVSSSASTTAYTAFGAFGDVLGSKQTTGGVDYNFSYSYNLAHTLTSIGYPNSGRVVTFAYDLANRVYSASGAVNGGTPIPYAAVPSGGFAPHSAIQTLNLNNAQLVETTKFDARLQPLSITAKWGAATRLGLTYNYCSDYSDIDFQHSCTTNNGNVWRQQIAFDALASAPSFSETQSYSYSDPVSGSPDPGEHLPMEPAERL